MHDQLKEFGVTIMHRARTNLDRNVRQHSRRVRSFLDRSKRDLVRASGHRTIALAIALALLVTPILTGVPRQAAAVSSGANVAVVVRELPGAGNGPKELVEQLGGEVKLQLGIINGFSAVVPESAVSELAAHSEIDSVTPDIRVLLAAWEVSDRSDDGAMHRINANVIQSTWYWKNGFTGDGIGVAIIDSGIAPVNGLTIPGKVVNGADLSFDSPANNLRYLDLYGHGTHLAGIIAGRDDAAPTTPKLRDLQTHYVGVAPGAQILNVKVADGTGTADVSQVIAAIDWVVQHRYDNGMNIRVLNLAFGTDGVQDYVLDPLAYAVEMAWREGIVVVVAAGNDGNRSQLRNPAYDPFVIAVGADDAQGTYGTDDDVIPSFSSCGSATRPVDLVAPGQSVISLRVPGSYADEFYPAAAVGDRFFRGTGTSQAAAVVSGAVALVLEQRPDLTPDQVKALLTSTARPIPGVSEACQGAGVIDLKAAFRAPTPDAIQTWTQSTGLGSLEAARGSYHVVRDGVALVGEQDIFGVEWDGVSWSGGDWSGVSWSGVSWSGVSWSGVSWSGVSWS
ncbi:MAG: S8 family serine peptidase, partial [Actinomycetota bacterium]|nr:S8 family serine peptidase [Actinomycetota bacterium]